MKVANFIILFFSYSVTDASQFSEQDGALHNFNPKRIEDIWEFLREDSAMFRLHLPSFDLVTLQEGEELPCFPSAPTKVIGGNVIQPSPDLEKLSKEKNLTRRKILNKVIVEEDKGERACPVLPGSTIFLESYLPAGKDMFQYQNFGGSQERSFTATRGWWYTASHFEPAMGESVSQLQCSGDGQKVRFLCISKKSRHDQQVSTRNFVFFSSYG